MIGVKGVKIHNLEDNCSQASSSINHSQSKSNLFGKIQNVMTQKINNEKIKSKQNVTNKASV